MKFPLFQFYSSHESRAVNMFLVWQIKHKDLVMEAVSGKTTQTEKQILQNREEKEGTAFSKCLRPVHPLPQPRQWRQRGQANVTGDQQLLF